MQNFTSIPFKSEKHDGFTVVNGIAKFSSAGIVLEFESKLLGLISGGVKEARLAVSDILDIEFKKGIFKRNAKIVLRATSLVKLNELPHSDGKLTLKIQHADFERARNAVAKLELDMAEEAASIPPYHTPVSLLFDDGEADTQKLED